MRKFTLIIAAMVSLIAMPAMAFEMTPIEDAVIDLNLSEYRRDYFAAAWLIRAVAIPIINKKGWKCTSVSYFHASYDPTLRMEVTCNQYRYTYEIIDRGVARGGNFEVKLK